MKRTPLYCVIFSALLSLGSHAALAAAEPTVTCAIRWDAWYTNGPSDPAHYTAAALSKPQWHSRAPLHAQFDASGNITWAPSQASFDAEIDAAHSANLCWAYLAYGTNHIVDLRTPMMQGLVYQRNSSINAEVKYALMTTTSLLGTESDYKDAVAATVALMRPNNYQHVLIRGESRPLLFLFFEASDLKTTFGSSVEKVKAPIDGIRNSSIAQGLGNPYIVVVMGSPSKAELVRKTLGADAISEYIAGTRKGHVELWAEFEPSIEADWDAFASASSADSVPTLRSGADIRARCQTPPPFEHRFPPNDKCDNYTVNPMLEELNGEFRNAQLWIKRHRDKDPAQLLLVYAWSECDESGNCLMPTYGDPTGQKLRAIGETLK